MRSQVRGFAEPTLSRAATIITGALIVLVVVCSFLGRFYVEALGFRVRYEQIAPLVLAGWMLVHPRLRGPFLRTVGHPVVLVFAAFVVWNLASTLLFSPDFRWSVSILIWLAIDLLLLMSIMALREAAELSAALLAGSVVPWALLGFASFAIANLTNGEVLAGAGFDWLYEIYTARVTAIEANIYASMLMLWSILSITRQGIRWRWIAVQCVAVPLGLIASQTRTAVFSLIGGLVVFAIVTLVVRRGEAWRARLSRLAPAGALIGALVVAYGVIAMFPSDGTGRNDPAVSPVTAPASAEAVSAGSPGPGAAQAKPAAAHPASSAVAPDAAAGGSNGASDAEPAVAAAEEETPQPEPSGYVPDPSNPDRQNKIGDIDFEGGTIGFRVTVAKMALGDLTGVHLWFGMGTNTFGYYHDQPGTPGVSGHIIMLPIQVLYDGGIVGLTLLIALFVAVFWWTPRERKPVAAGVLASFLVSSTLTSFFWFAMSWILFAVLLRPSGDDRTLPQALRRAFGERRPS